MDRTIESVTVARENCEGVAPLAARLEDWMVRVAGSEQLPEWVEQYGSPLNLHHARPFERNVARLRRAAMDRKLDFEIFFARKANKCLNFVHIARDIGCGIDTASEAELEQVLAANLPTEKIICTAAIKSRSLLQGCADAGVTIAIDNYDELRLLCSIADVAASPLSVAIRISGFHHQGQKLFSRFGFDVDCSGELLDELTSETCRNIRVEGLHFHQDGYSIEERVSAIGQSLELIDAFRSRSSRIRFLDIGGGIPMNYLASAQQWPEFCDAHRDALLGNRPPLTWQNHGLGLTSIAGGVQGKLNLYPGCHDSVQADWLSKILDAKHGDGTLASEIRSRDMQLRCEPGRSILDGCGMTVARVEFRKKHPAGHWLIGLSMNHTQCKTSHDDFMVDPLLIKTGQQFGNESEFAHHAMEGYLVGAYCTEFEFLTLRRLRFPYGVGIGDLVVFPNTAGYLMHFCESRSHQFPLARNVFVANSDSNEPVLLKSDPIDVLS